MLGTEENIYMASRRRRDRSQTPTLDVLNEGIQEQTNPAEGIYIHRPPPDYERNESMHNVEENTYQMDRMLDMYQRSTEDYRRTTFELHQALRESRQEFLNALSQQQTTRDTLDLTTRQTSQLGDPWVEQMGRLGVRRFEGGNDPMTNKKWIKKMTNTLETLAVPEESWVRLAIYHMEGDADAWWRKARELEFPGKALSDIKWVDFVEVFDREYFPTEVYEALAEEFDELRQGTKTVEEYATEFYRLEEYRGTWKSEATRIRRFMKGLRRDIQERLIAADRTQLKSVVYKAIECQRFLTMNEKNVSRPFSLYRPSNNRSSYYGGFDRSGKRGRFQSGSYHRGSSSNSSVGSARAPSQTMTCYTCGKTGHTSPQCQNQFQRPTVGFNCYNCGKSGHLMRNCPDPPKRVSETSKAPTKGRVYSISAPKVVQNAEDVVEGEQHDPPSVE